MIVMDELLTIKEVAQKLKMHPDTIKRMLIAGKMPGYKIEGSWRVKQDELERWIEDRKNIAKD